jgi:hypothetical protein
MIDYFLILTQEGELFLERNVEWGKDEFDPK